MAAMFDDPSEPPAEPPSNPAERAREKSDEFRMHAELAAVFEGCRKFGAQLLPGLDPELALDLQRTFGRLEKSKSPDSPILPEPSSFEAGRLLRLSQASGLSTSDYHIHRRPGEVIIVRWLEGIQVSTFYERIQAHFDAALIGYRDEERQSHEWKQDPRTLAYLAALDAIDVRMADRYLRDPIRTHNLFVLSSQSADEINIAYLSDYLLGVPPVEVVGPASAPPDAPTESDLAWFFKLFALRGMDETIERMCFFTYLQKTEDTFASDQ
jgi:hypothetical protein